MSAYNYNIHYISFGCKVNLYETAHLRHMFISEGFDPVENEEDADIVLINTCTVTAESDKKLRKTINRIRRVNPGAIIALTGCFPQAFPNEAKALGVEIITGSRNKTELLPLIKEYFALPSPVMSVPSIAKSHDFESMVGCTDGEKTRAFLKIQDGCDRYCSYCIIPKARGGMASRNLNEIRAETEFASATGHREIVLVGINLASYGIEEGLTIADAIDTVATVKGIERIRLGSLEPEMLTDGIIERMAEQKKLCPHFHLSLQSGCDRTLKAMKRRYTTAEYREIVVKLREKFKNCAITTDIMVGFPDETDDDFAESCRFVEEIGFSQAHIFAYSRRKGTVAYSMENQVDEKLKRERAERMSKITILSQKRYLSSQVGRVVPVLFERESSPDFHNGHSPEYMFIKVPKKSCEKSLRNMIFYVRILKIENNCAVGEIISPDEL